MVQLIQTNNTTLNSSGLFSSLRIWKKKYIFAEQFDEVYLYL